MGLFDSIIGAVTGASGQDEKGDGEGAQNILGSLLQQGMSGQSGNIVGQLIGAFGGGTAGGAPANGAAGGGLQSVLETLAANGLGEQVGSWLSNSSNLPVSPE